MLKGKTALITGGSRGIGSEIATIFALNHANVAILYAGRKDAADQMVKKLSGYGVQTAAYMCDVSKYDLVEQTVTKVLSDFGGLDILVNNAGIVRDGLILSMNEEDFDRVIDINLKGSFNMIRHTYRHFMKQRSGRIINISSVVGLSGNAGQANYASSKAGIIGLTKSTARELAGRNVLCNAIAPGFIETDMTESLSDKVKESYIASIPLKRAALSSEVAGVALFLASDLSSYITGEVIRVDGGLTM
jgi:3-oxoacyl-[acyl-carrier protein] reductase